jgi:flagellar biosynthesis/type III secretory pathway protein FliH
MTQFQTIGAPVQQLLSDGVSMALEGLAVSQAQGKKLLESAVELGTANAKDGLKYAEELRSRLTEATNSANEILKEHAALFNELPKDPVAASQKVISGYVEGSRKALEVGAEALKGYVNLVNDLWSRLEQTSRDIRENYVAYVGRLQSIVESTAKKN